MILQEHIRKILREESFKDEVKKRILDDGLWETAKLFGGIDNLVNMVYDGNLKNYYQENKIKPYYISSEPNLFIDDSLVQILGLEDSTFGGNPEKKLGTFTWKSGGRIYKFIARMYPMYYDSGKKMWRVVGTSGDYGFGYFFITKRNTLGKRARMEIFKQVIDKYKLDRFN